MEELLRKSIFTVSSPVIMTLVNVREVLVVLSGTSVFSVCRLPLLMQTKKKGRRPVTITDLLKGLKDIFVRFFFSGNQIVRRFCSMNENRDFPNLNVVDLRHIAFNEIFQRSFQHHCCFEVIP
jgi:hypothetical protein